MATADAELLKHPLQPIYTDDNNTYRFKSNAIIRHLIDHGSIDLNQIACMNFPREDRMQLAQLIGYSVYGWGTLSYVDDESYSVAWEKAEKAAADKEGGLVDEQAARIAYLEAQLRTVTDSLKKLVPEVFSIHPDDLEPRASFRSE